MHGRIRAFHVWNNYARKEYSFRRSFFGMDKPPKRRQIYAMGQAERPTCSHCGAYLTSALPPGGKGKRTFQCFDCDGPDPLTTEKTMGWLKGELGRRDENAS